ncbi:DUF485 domain-containing protein [Kitasatospora sp. NPDC094015]|uniref:DUF485 domain-containing protein n=1 Tax=Kitasatospora sp. NPDC094015 TaxID=3155205 RepID=UPI003321AE23
MAQQDRFDWWAAEPAGRATGQPVRPAGAVRTGGPGLAPGPVQVAVPPAPVPPPAPAAPAQPSAPEVRAVPVVPPSAPGRPAPSAGEAEGPGAEAGRADATGQVYRSVQQSPAFQQIRRGYRGFAFPATGLFLGWYLLYLAAQAAAPGLMRRQVAGPVNVAWLLGLLQFASTFLLTWLYARNARTKRDRAALELRWDTQDQLR